VVARWLQPLLEDIAGPVLAAQPNQAVYLMVGWQPREDGERQGTVETTGGVSLCHLGVTPTSSLLPGLLQ